MVRFISSIRELHLGWDATSECYIFLQATIFFSFWHARPCHPVLWFGGFDLRNIGSVTLQLKSQSANNRVEITLYVGGFVRLHIVVTYVFYTVAPLWCPFIPFGIRVPVHRLWNHIRIIFFTPSIEEYIWLRFAIGVDPCDVFIDWLWTTLFPQLVRLASSIIQSITVTWCP